MKAGRFVFVCALIALFSFAAPSLAADIAVDAGCTLADAIEAANRDEAVGGCPAGDGVDVIALSADVTLEAELPHFATKITVEGGGFSISGARAYRIFYVEASGTLTIKQLTLVDGRSGPENAPGLWTGDGGAIYNVGTLMISDSTFANNMAGQGGAIANSGKLDIVLTSFVENSAYAGPGAILNFAGAAMSIRESTFSLNSGHFGGALANRGELHLSDSVFNSNKADSAGAISSLGKSTIRNSSFRYNSAKDGGAIGNSGEHTISESVFTENFALQEGGAIRNFGTLRVDSSVFTRNIAGAGGLNVAYPELPEANRSYHPYVTGYGGAINNEGDAVLYLDHSAFTENAAGFGGAIGGAGEMGIARSAFFGNRADKRGGAIFNLAQQNVGNCIFVGNSAEEGGGFLLFDNGSHSSVATLSHVTLLENSAENGGGILVDANPQATVRLYNSILADNVGGDCLGELSQSQGNLIKDGSCDAEIGGDPMLGDLVQPEDGSPPYYSLLPGSPAIDVAISDHCPDTDQIGTARPQGEACDIGAIEYVPEE